MNDSEYRKLIEAGWRRRLTHEEQARLNAWLTEHTDLRADWEAETALNEALARLPDAPLSSNFTAQTMQAIDTELAQANRKRSLLDRLKAFFRPQAPRVAWTLLLITFLWLGMHQHQKASRHELATGLAALANVAALPDPKALQDLDAVQHLSQLPAREDEELFKVLSQ
jgi:anti-sigma factor RsiW